MCAYMLSIKLYKKYINGKAFSVKNHAVILQETVAYDNIFRQVLCVCMCVSPAFL